MAKLSPKAIKAALPSVRQWKRKRGVITRVFEFKDFEAAMRFVNAVAERAEEAWHHPDIDIRWNRVTLTLTTHYEDGLTEKDFELARQFDHLALPLA